MKHVLNTIKWSALALFLILVPGSLMASQIVVKINDLAVGPPQVEVDGAPNGYDVYTGPGVNNSAVEDGALITLFGVDTYGSIPDWGGRIIDPTPWQLLPPLYNQNDPTDPTNYRQFVNAVDIVWVQHDFDGPFQNGDLQVGFNSSFQGVWYRNPSLTGDEDLGPLSNKWVTIYSSPALVIKFKGPGITPKK
jgi:hypothetical protein